MQQTPFLLIHNTLLLGQISLFAGPENPLGTEHPLARPEHSLADLEDSLGSELTGLAVQEALEARLVVLQYIWGDQLFSRGPKYRLKSSAGQSFKQREFSWESQNLLLGRFKGSGGTKLQVSCPYLTSRNHNSDSVKYLTLVTFSLQRI